MRLRELLTETAPPWRMLLSAIAVIALAALTRMPLPEGTTARSREPIAPLDNAGRDEPRLEAPDGGRETDAPRGSAPGTETPPSEEPLPFAPNYLRLPRYRPDELPLKMQRIRQEIIEEQPEDAPLYESSAFTIDYLPRTDVFIVLIEREPVLEMKARAQEWFRGFGLTQSDLCDLPVRFILGDFTLRTAYRDFSSLPDGCPAPQ